MSEHGIELTAENFAPPKDLGRLQTGALVAAVVGVAVSVLGVFVAREQFFQSYLVAYVFWLSISLGSLGLLCLQHMTQGAWGLLPRRINEASAGGVALLAVLFVPIWLGMGDLFHWVHPEAGDKLLQSKTWYLNLDFYGKRIVAYFLVWIVLWWLMRMLSGKQDRQPSAQLIARMRRVAAPGIIALAVIATFSSVDFLMSLDPHWYSSLYGIYFIGTQLVASMCFLIVMGRWLSQRSPMDQVLTPKVFHAQGKLLLAFVMLWAYFGVSQLIIIWSGNLPEEILWYQHRQAGGWQYVALALVFLHFLLPFLLLLSQPRKMDAKRLSRVALLLLVVHWLDYFWQAAPNWNHHLSFHWLDFATMLGLGGLWFGCFVFLLRRRPVLPFKDPYVPEALSHESHCPSRPRQFSRTELVPGTWRACFQRPGDQSSVHWLHRGRLGLGDCSCLPFDERNGELDGSRGAGQRPASLGSARSQ